MATQNALYLLTQVNFQISVIKLSNKEIGFQDIIELIKTQDGSKNRIKKNRRGIIRHKIIIRTIPFYRKIIQITNLIYQAIK